MRNHFEHWFVWPSGMKESSEERCFELLPTLTQERGKVVESGFCPFSFARCNFWVPSKQEYWNEGFPPNEMHPFRDYTGISVFFMTHLVEDF